METEKFVRWSGESKDFFNSAADDSLVLEIVISHGCISQSGEGFLELVNSINGDNIRRKIKKVNITDTSYLYRYDMPDFAKYADQTELTPWLRSNRDSVEKIAKDCVVKSWKLGLENDEFKRWFEKIKIDFEGDQNGNGVVLEFRDLVMQDSAIVSYKNKLDIRGCIDFMLEECAYAAANLNGSVVVYPTRFVRPIENIIKRYNLNIVHLGYKTSKQAQKNAKECMSRISSISINREIVRFMTDAPNVNFFVIDRTGKQIYKNYALEKIIGDIENTKNVYSLAWETTRQVMKTGKQTIVEETMPQGATYLSVKSPLVIDDKVEGVIGLAVDVTDRRKAEQLEFQKKLWENKKIIAEQVAHDIQSPLIVLELFAKNCKNLTEKESYALRNVAANMKDIIRNLQNDRIAEARNNEAYILLPFVFAETANYKKFQYKEFKNLKIECSSDLPDNFVFIRGNVTDFGRMASNLLNNAIESVDNKTGEIKTTISATKNEVRICVKDDGAGMPQEIIDKILEDVSVTTKQDGHGIGMRQINKTLREMNGKMSIKSKENEGTEITLVFPRSEPPSWFAQKIVLNKDDLVVVLDDNPSIGEVWENRMKSRSNDVAVKFFQNGRDVIDFVNSRQNKDKIVLLADYELKNQDVNGIEVIEKCGIERRSVIVTGSYTREIKNFSEKFKVAKFLPKSCINDVRLVFGE
ncbi:MAG: GHKL domain-containing protein [Holosporaceae bacterium]|jgi:signal transduction histidine kinase|nr:GHKL domain-containing protein [Holosporaceae bacterium]